MDPELVGNTANKVIKLLKEIYNWPKSNFTKQVFVSFLFTFLVYLSVVILIGYIFYMHKENNINNNVETTYVANSNKLKTVSELITLCISSQKEKSKNTNFYCDHATELFKINIRTNTSYEQKLINTHAYELMLISINSELRSLEYIKLINTRKSAAYELILDEFFTGKGLFLFTTTLLSIFLAQLLFFKRKELSAKNTPINQE